MVNRPRIIVFAYSEPGYACLNELIKAKANIVAIYTHIDDPDEEIWFPSVYDLAIKHDIPVFRSAKITEEMAKEIRAFKADLIFSFYYRRLIPNDIILSPRLGSYNLHGALLPKYRGQTCINWAVVNGEKRTGATLHKMTAKADDGDIVAQYGFDIAFEDTAIDVFHKVSAVGAKIIRENLLKIESGIFESTKQDDRKATKFPRRRPDDGLLDFNKDAISLYNLIRGVTHPFPGAFTYVNNQKLFIWWAVPVKNTSDIKTIENYSVGEIVSINPLCVSTNKGLLELKSLQFAGQEEAQADLFADKLPIGTKFEHKL